MGRASAFARVVGLGSRWLRNVRPRGGGSGGSWGASPINFRAAVNAGRAAGAMVRAQRRRKNGRWKAFMGTRSQIRRPIRVRPRVEQMEHYKEIGTNDGPLPFKRWLTTATLHEMFTNHVPTSHNYTTGTFGYTQNLQQGVGGDTNFTGAEINIKQQEIRLCMEAGADQSEALCCRLVVIQITDESTDKAANAFTLGDFYESSNITSFRKKNPEHNYKVLMDKTFTVSPETGGAGFADRHMTLNFPTGRTRISPLGLTGNAVNPGGRIVWGLFTEIAPTVTLGPPVTTDAPQFYGNYKFAYTDQ